MTEKLDQRDPEKLGERLLAMAEEARKNGHDVRLSEVHDLLEKGREE